MSTTKKVLSQIVSSKLGISQKDSLILIKSFFKFVKDNQSLTINIANFGTFSSKQTPKRIGRNPKSLEEFQIKAREKLNFKPSDEVKKIIN